MATFLAVVLAPAVVLGARELWRRRSSGVARLAAALLVIWLGYALVGVSWFWWYFVFPLVAAAVTGAPAEHVTGRGTGVDDATLARKVAVVRRALDVNRPDARDGLDVLAKVGGYEIGGLAGVILAGAARRVPVVLDGFSAGAPNALRSGGSRSPGLVQPGDQR